MPAPAAVANEAAAAFTGWYNKGQLRGCIGSLSPCPLHDNLRGRALDAALNDTRFAAIRRSELPDLTCNVNVLHSFEPANDRYDWTIGKHGLTIHFSDPQRPSRSYKATYLPSVMTKFEMTKDDAIRELIKKGGYHGTITESLLNRIEVTRFQSSEKESCYQKYLDYYRNLRLTDVVHLEPEEKEEETEGHAADITGSRKANGRR
jgi:uncharacterized protein (TIGR00296 family)